MLAQGNEKGTGAEAENPMTYKEVQYDLLAETLREHLDIPKIYKILDGSMES
jgi:cobyric acid synthase